MNPPAAQPLSPAYAGFWLRLAAACADAVVMNLTLTIAVLVVTFAHVSFLSVSMVGNTIGWIFFFGYFALLESKTGATWGKRLVGIQVTRLDGMTPGYLRALGRNAAKILSFLPFGIGFLIAGFTRKKQALHDMIVSCVVVKTKETSFGKALGVIILAIAASAAMTGYVGAQFAASTWSFLGNDKSDLSMEIAPTTVQNTSTSTPLTEAEYEAYMSKPLTLAELKTIHKAGVSDEKAFLQSKSVAAGPVLLIFNSDLFYTHLKVALPDIPGFTTPRTEDGTLSRVGGIWNDTTPVRVEITSILTTAGKEINDKNSSYEKEFWQYVLMSQYDDPTPHLEAERKLNFVDGFVGGFGDEAWTKQVGKIIGTVHIKAPLAEGGTFERSYPFTLVVNK